MDYARKRQKQPRQSDNGWNRSYQSKGITQFEKQVDTWRQSESHFDVNGLAGVEGHLLIGEIFLARFGETQKKEGTL
jgi:hypothetical protein